MSHLNPYAAPESPLLRCEPDDRPNRTAMAWGFRYMLVGAVIGLILPLFVFPSTIPPVFIMPVFGAVVGSAIGCVGGAFEHWIKPSVRGKKRFLAERHRDLP
jgi:hypothetical protein